MTLSIGDKTIIVQEKSGDTVAIPMNTFSIGDKIIMMDNSIKSISTKLISPVVGDKVLIAPSSGGKYVVIGGISLTPVADFTVNTRSACVRYTFRFTDTSTNTPTSWLWDFGDLSTSTAQNPSHKYLVDGTYTVSLTVTNVYGSNTKTKINYITVTPAPVIGFDFNSYEYYYYYPILPGTMNISGGTGIFDYSNPPIITMGVPGESGLLDGGTGWVSASYTITDLGGIRLAFECTDSPECNVPTRYISFRYDTNGVPLEENPSKYIVVSGYSLDDVRVHSGVYYGSGDYTVDLTEPCHKIHFAFEEGTTAEYTIYANISNITYSL